MGRILSTKWKEVHEQHETTLIPTPQLLNRPPPRMPIHLESGDLFAAACTRGELAGLAPVERTVDMD
jgi:hypothetical protein